MPLLNKIKYDKIKLQTPTKYLISTNGFRILILSWYKFADLQLDQEKFGIGVKSRESVLQESELALELIKLGTNPSIATMNLYKRMIISMLLFAFTTEKMKEFDVG